MAPAPSTELTRVERDVLDHYKEGVGARTIAMRVNLETTDVQTIISEVAGGDRTRAASLVAAYNRRHPEVAAEAPPVPTPYSPGPPAENPPPTTPPATGPARRGRAASPAAKRPRAAAQTPQDEPVAPTVVPVDLTDVPPVDVPVTIIDDPAPVTADPLGAPAGAAAAAQHFAEKLPTVGHWSGARAPDLPIDSCTHGGDCPVHPNAQSLHNFDTDPRAADLDFPALAAAPALVDPLDGPTEALPDVGSFDELMAAVAGVPELAELAGRVTTLVDVLHDKYDREQQARKVRGEALILRRELATRLALLVKLADGDGPAARELTSPKATAAA